MSVTEVYVRDLKAQASPFPSLNSLHLKKSIEYAATKDPVINSLLSGLQTEWKPLVAFHDQYVQLDGSTLQRGQKDCGMEWKARSMTSKVLEFVSVQGDGVLNGNQQCSVMWQLDPAHIGKQNPLKSVHLPSDKVSETGDLYIQEEDVFLLPARAFHIHLTFLAFIFTLLLLFVYLCL
jgi:hypothetical protein